MKTQIIFTAAAVLVCATIAIIGCSKSSGPVASNIPTSSEEVLAQSLSTENVVAQDLSQLSSVKVVESVSTGVFSIGWDQFIGPNIENTGLLGTAFVVVSADSTQLPSHPVGLDIGTVTVSYNSTSTDLSKKTTPGGGVLYSTFNQGLRSPESVPVNIPFIANGSYQFIVSGSASFSAGTFTITAPASLLQITNHANGDSISTSNDLTIAWAGGSATDSVLVRVVPHLRPEQINGRCPGMVAPPPGRGDIHPMGEHGCNGPHPGDSLDHGMPFNLGPEFLRAFIKMTTNSGNITVSSSDLQTLLNGTSSAELMVGITQVVKQNILHDARTITLLLKSGDQVVLKVR
jgi:hypothetical protein